MSKRDLWRTLGLALDGYDEATRCASPDRDRLLPVRAVAVIKAARALHAAHGKAPPATRASSSTCPDCGHSTDEHGDQGCVHLDGRGRFCDCRAGAS